MTRINSVITCYDKDGNETDCGSDHISSVRIVEDVVMGTPTVSLCFTPIEPASLAFQYI